MDLYVKILRLFVAGALGVDFSVNTDNIEEGVAKVAKGILEHGVTSFCPTIVTSSESTYKQVPVHIRFNTRMVLHFLNIFAFRYIAY